MRICLVAVAVGIVTAACGATAPASPAPVSPSASASAPGSAAAAPSRSGISGLFAVDGHDMRIECQGTGSPTVVLEAGLGGAGTAWAGVLPDIARLTRVCTYDRAGLGGSDQRPGNPPTSVGAMAKEAWGLFAAAGIDDRLVLVGHSFGGMIVRVVAHDHPEQVAGLVLVDASSGHQFEGAWLKNDEEWFDGGPVDRQQSANDLTAVTDLGSIPLVVLTQGKINGDFEGSWAQFQDELAALSTNSLHLVARGSGHEIAKEAPQLLTTTVGDVVAAVRGSSRLAPCGEALEQVGAECLASTMQEQLAEWDRLRALVKATPGALPAGTYRETLTGTKAAEITGEAASFKEQVLTWKLDAGRWSLSVIEDGSGPDETSDVYQVSGNAVVFRIPTDWKIPRTPGVNHFTWAVDANGTLTFQQVDHERREAAFGVPWLRVGPAG
jgi:pimeloyl-ACP methyl ester carboxylesterase